MPCYLTDCDPANEAKRFFLSLGGLYVYHFVWDSILIRPSVKFCLRRGWITKDKVDKMRESMWKNAAVGSFFLFGLYIGSDKDWFMNPKGYFVEWPYVAPENLSWYYMIYLSFWIQSIDFLLNITNKHYNVKRKDNAEMILHHFATIALMVFSYTFDLTRVGMCVLMIHDVNDLLLETAKIFVYLQWETVANIFFGTFAITWYIVRWGFYSYNILYAVYTEGWNSIIVPTQAKGGIGGIPGPMWYWIWLGFFSFLSLLLVLHVYWGYLIFRMIINTLQQGNVEKDIRSDSEAEDESDVVSKSAKAEVQEESDASFSAASGDEAKTSKPRRRRAPKAE